MSAAIELDNSMAERAWRRPYSFLVDPHSRSSSPLYESSEDETLRWKPVVSETQPPLRLGSLRERLKDKPVANVQPAFVPVVQSNRGREQYFKSESYCKLCKVDLSSKIALVQHEEAKHRFVCKDCGQHLYGFRNKHRGCPGFRVNRAEIRLETNTWACCKKTFNTRSDLHQHQSKKHFEDLLCLTCQRVFATVDSCQEHMQAKHPLQYASKFFRKPPHLA